MKVQHGTDMANFPAPESSVNSREGAIEALTGKTGRSGIEPRNQESGTPTSLSGGRKAIRKQGANRKSCERSARSETL